MVKCSDGHGRKQAALLYRGVLAAAPDGPPSVEWVEHGAVPAPPLGEPGGDGDRKVTLRCNVCGRDTQMQVGLLARALRALADAGLKDGSGRVTLDIAKVPR